MNLLHEAVAGTENKEDVKITIRPGGEAVQVIVHSTVAPLFGAQIEASVREVLKQYGVDGCVVEIDDKSALDYVIRARMETAVRRGVEEPK